MADAFTSDTYNALCQEAEEYLGRGLVEQARELLLKAVSLIGTRPRARSILADACMSKGLWSEAREQLEVLTTLEIDNTPHHYRLGQVLEELGEYDLARDNYQVVLDHDPSYKNASVAVARLTGKIQSQPQAIDLSQVFGVGPSPARPAAPVQAPAFVEHEPGGISALEAAFGAGPAVPPPAPAVETPVPVQPAVPAAAAAPEPVGMSALEAAFGGAAAGETAEVTPVPAEAAAVHAGAEAPPSATPPEIVSEAAAPVAAEPGVVSPEAPPAPAPAARPAAPAAFPRSDVQIFPDAPGAEDVFATTDDLDNLLKDIGVAPGSGDRDENVQALLTSVGINLEPPAPRKPPEPEKPAVQDISELLGDDGGRTSRVEVPEGGPGSLGIQDGLEALFGSEGPGAAEPARTSPPDASVAGPIEAASALPGVPEQPLREEQTAPGIESFFGDGSAPATPVEPVGKAILPIEEIVPPAVEDLVPAVEEIVPPGPGTPPAPGIESFFGQPDAAAPAPMPDTAPVVEAFAQAPEPVPAPVQPAGEPAAAAPAAETAVPEPAAEAPVQPAADGGMLEALMATAELPPAASAPAAVPDIPAPAVPAGPAVPEVPAVAPAAGAPAAEAPGAPEAPRPVPAGSSSFKIQKADTGQLVPVELKKGTLEIELSCLAALDGQFEMISSGGKYYVTGSGLIHLGHAAFEPVIVRLEDGKLVRRDRLGFLDAWTDLSDPVFPCAPELVRVLRNGGDALLFAGARYREIRVDGSRIVARTSSLAFADEGVLVSAHQGGPGFVEITGKGKALLAL